MTPFRSKYLNIFRIFPVFIISTFFSFQNPVSRYSFIPTMTKFKSLYIWRKFSNFRFSITRMGTILSFSIKIIHKFFSAIQTIMNSFIVIGWFSSFIQYFSFCDNFRMRMFCMLTTSSKQLKIFYSIIRFNSIYMMNSFFGIKIPTKKFFYYKSMFSNIILFTPLRMIWRINIPISCSFNFPRITFSKHIFYYTTGNKQAQLL